MIGECLNALHAHGCNPKRSANGYMAKCPAHSDSSPSLSVAEGAKGGVVMQCFAGCELDAILSALNLDRDVIRPPRDGHDDETWTPYGPALDTYRYTDEDGNLLFEVLRCTNKNFPQRRPDPTAKSGWSWKLGGVRRPLYRLPKLAKAIEDGEPIFVCEGEKDVHALERAGCVATCNPGGAGVGKWLAEHTQTLTEADVVIVADRDDIGRRHARAIEDALKGVARAITRVEPAEGKDAYDHLAAGLSPEDFLCVSESDRVFDLAPTIGQFLGGTDDYHWIVPGLLERGDRLMLTGFEGMGKSEWLRQTAICLAAGIHPFRFSDVRPCKVLFLDCENSERHTRRRLRPLYELANARRQIDDENMRLIIKPAGLDLTREDDATWLHERVVAHQPDVLIIGPLYRLHTQSPNDEQVARAIVQAIDDARTVVDCAVILEAHAGHAESGKARSVRPVGSSLWLRWPEFGYGMFYDAGQGDRDTFEFRQWRGPREERQWPDQIRRGSVWPWEGIYRHGIPSIPDDDF